MFRFRHYHVICCICIFQFFGTAAQSQNFDINLLKSINPRVPTSGFWKTTSYSYMIVAGAASLGPLAYAIINNDKELKYKSAETLASLGINIAVTSGLKVLFNRKRPTDKYPGEVFSLTTSKGHSFPSGHTSLAFATATSLTLVYKKWYVIVPAYVWAGCMGYSRMYLGKHCPSDVLCGAIVGTGSSLLSHWLFKKYFVPQPLTPPESHAL